MLDLEKQKEIFKNNKNEIAEETKKVTIYKFNPYTMEFLQKIDNYEVLKGLSLPADATTITPPTITDHINIFDRKLNNWTQIKDNRNTIYYSKSTGEEYKTKIINEQVDLKLYTKVKPPVIKDNELLRFNTFLQRWIVGINHYEKPIFDSNHNIFYCDTDFFIPDNQYTHIKPTEEQTALKFILNSVGDWIKNPEPEPQTEPEPQEE